jgi:hypothetical protein
MSNTYEYTLNAEHAKRYKKQDYVSPKLICYGAVRDLTQNGSKNSNELTNAVCFSQPNNTKAGPCASERSVKENIVRIGTHPLGIGLYLFDYLPEHRVQWGQGRQFGVMIDEVETIMPEAVSSHEDGYKRVDYALLGITRYLH